MTENNDTSQQPGPKKPTLFFLYIPGGGVLGIIPAVVLARLEELLERPTMHFFHASDGVSVGGDILIALNIPADDDPVMPKFTAAETAEMICMKVQKFFPPVKGRMRMMLTSNMLNMAKRFLDPAVADGLRLQEIKNICDEMEKSAGEKTLPLVESLKHHATQPWLTPEHRDNAYKLCDRIRQIEPGLRSQAASVLTHVYERTQQASHLGIIFRRAALSVSDIVLRNWAREQDYLYDTKIILQTYRDMFAQTRIGDSLRSLYVSTSNASTGHKIPFFARKKDFLTIGATENAAVSKGNHTMVDVAMSTTAHPMAVPPHLTEDGLLTTDPGVWHTPTASILQVIREARNAHPGVNVKLVVIGTGDFMSSEADKTDTMSRMTKVGVLGNIIDGFQLSAIQSYVMSDAKRTLSEELGDEDIIEISPRLAPLTSSEAREFPSRDILNTSQDNIERVLKTARRTLSEKDLLIRNLAFTLAENMHLLGQMDDDEFARISEKIKTAITPPLETGIGRDIPDIFERVLARNERNRLASWFGNSARFRRPKAANDDTPPTTTSDDKGGSQPEKKTGTNDPAP